MLAFGKPQSKTDKSKKGFTLIELSIVLVIIGLIVGGILVGQDLIKAAEIRATIAQVEKYNSAVNTFRNKYGGIPGDLNYVTASNFGLPVVTSGGAAGLGDGNGLIEGTGGSGATTFLGEPPLFWAQLSNVNFVDGSYGTGNNGMAVLTSGGAIASCTSAYSCDSYMPPAKLGRGNSLTVASFQGYNYFFMAGWNNIPSTGIYSSTANTNNLTPNEAYGIDKKVDDGLPGSGAVQAFNAVGAFTAATLTSNAFMTPTVVCQTGQNYYVTVGSTQSTTVACGLRFQFN